VQSGAGIGAQANDVARVRWNLRLIQDDIDQERNFPDGSGEPYIKHTKK
jgi:hypothetical protein